ncbi:hypothetical protein [Limibacillus halophilus]
MKQMLLLSLMALVLAACTGAYVSYGGYYPYGYDYGFRYGIYDVHHDIDVDVNRPDRPRPPPGYKPDRPRPPVARPNRPTTLPAQVKQPRPSRPPRQMRAR